MCDLFGGLCFRERMGDLDKLREMARQGEEGEGEGGCLPDCEAVTFTFSESSTLIRWGG